MSGSVTKVVIARMMLAHSPPTIPIFVFRVELDVRSLRSIDDLTAMTVAVTICSFDRTVSHNEELDDEKDEDCHQDDAGYPIVLGNRTCQTRISECILCWTEEMDERCCDNDAGTEEFGNEERPVGHAHAPVLARKDWEDSAEG